MWSSRMALKAFLTSLLALPVIMYFINTAVLHIISPLSNMESCNYVHFLYFMTKHSGSPAGHSHILIAFRDVYLICAMISVASMKYVV